MLADDHSFLRARAAELLNRQEDMQVVGECADGRDVLGLAQVVQPHLVLMDLHMPVMSGLAATRALLSMRPITKVLMLTASVHRRLVEECQASGASGCLPKDGDAQRLVDAVRTIAAGGTTWPIGAAASLAG